MRHKVFAAVHGLSHPSGRATVQQMRQKYVWPSIKKDVIEWARNCLPCQRAKIHRHNHLVPNKIDMPDNRFDHIHLDIVVMPTANGYRYCLTMIDRFSRWPEAIPLKDITADTITTKFWTYWVSRFGCPKTITTDQGTQFEAELFKAMSRLMGCKQIHTTAYHPQSNGMVERWHRSFKAALMCDPTVPWIELLPSVLLGLRTCFKEDLQGSAAEMLYSGPIRLPNEFYDHDEEFLSPEIFIEKFREHIRLIRPVPVAHHRNKSMFVHKNLQDCSHVFMRVDSVKPPLEPPYTGPYKVIDRPTDRTDADITVTTEKPLRTYEKKFRERFIGNRDQSLEEE